MELFSFLDLPLFIQTIGYAGLFAVIFAESGFLLGIFFPGDSLLFTAGILASQRLLDIWLVILVCFAGAVLGDSFGYFFGKKIGVRIFQKEESFFFRKSYLEKAKQFYAAHGKKTIILARFIPVIRTLAPILAGVGEMHYPIFLLFNVLGGALWAIGVPLMGYYLGSFIPGIDRYLIPIVGFIIVASMFPVLREMWRMRKKS